jgi:hypothetical protein
VILSGEAQKILRGQLAAHERAPGPSRAPAAHPTNATTLDASSAWRPGRPG